MGIMVEILRNTVHCQCPFIGGGNSVFTATPNAHILSPFPIILPSIFSSNPNHLKTLIPTLADNSCHTSSNTHIINRDYINIYAN